MADALVLSGAGAYADAWHPFAVTSGRVAGTAFVASPPRVGWWARESVSVVMERTL